MGKTMVTSKIFLVLVALVVLVFISGCVVSSTCGNQVCEFGENSYSCPDDCGAEMDETMARAAWKSAEPWGIVDWSVEENGAQDNLIVILKNNSYDTLELVEFNQGTVRVTFEKETFVAPGETKTIYPLTGQICENGEKYILDNITITYNTTDVIEKQQSGMFPLIGIC